MQEVRFEDVLQECGDFGLFQKTVMTLIMPFALLHAMQTAGSNFLVPHHEHWCKISALEHLPYHMQKDLAIPYNSDDSEDEYSSCEMFNLEWNNFTMADFESWNRTLMTNGASQTECSKYVYDYTDYTKTCSSQVRYVFFQY